MERGRGWGVGDMGPPRGARARAGGARARGRGIQGSGGHAGSGFAGNVPGSLGVSERADWFTDWFGGAVRRSPDRAGSRCQGPRAKDRPTFGLRYIRSDCSDDRALLGSGPSAEAGDRPVAAGPASAHFGGALSPGEAIARPDEALAHGLRPLSVGHLDADGLGAWRGGGLDREGLQGAFQGQEQRQD